MARVLRLMTVEDNTEVGSVVLTRGKAELAGAARSVFATMRRYASSDAELFDLLSGGWSNGAVLFLPEQKGTAALVAHLPGKHDQSSHGKGGVRGSLADAGSTAEVSAVAETELGGLLGHDVSVDLGEMPVEVARVHMEGVLRGAEFYPHADLRAINVSNIAETNMTTAISRGDRITFDEHTSFADLQRSNGLAHGWIVGDRGDLTVYGTHEYGHVAIGEGARLESGLAAARQAATDVNQPTWPFVKDQISGYAAADARELVAEAFTDVVTSGGSPLSRSVVSAALGPDTLAGG